MYTITNNYKNELEEKTSIKSKSKIIVNNIEYTSIIKTTPKISHKSNSMFGGFPIKTCSFEIYDLDGNLDFKDKQIYVYKGIEINGTIEYVLQGLFIPRAEQITTNVSQKTIKFEKIQDKGQLFNAIYKSNLDWTSTHTGLEIVQEICNNLGIELETTTFNWYDYNFKQPNFKENTTYREVISRIAEIGGSIAFISRDGKLTIKSQYTTNHIILSKRYVKLSKEEQYGPINVVVLGKENINDDIFYPEIKPLNPIEWKILDNPFVDLYREEMIEKVSNYIIGTSITPFELTDFVDGFCYDLNDVLKVVDKNGNNFNAVVLNYETTSRIRSNVGADTQETNTTDYNLAGSSKQNYMNLKLDVDHINKEIIGIVEETTDLNSKVSKVRQTVDDVSISLSKVSDNLNNDYYQKNEVEQLILNTESGLINTFTKSGGNNLLRNTALWNMKTEDEAEFWDGKIKQIEEDEAISGYAIFTQQGTVKQSVSLVPGTYSLSFKYKRIISASECSVRYNGKTFNLTEETGEIHTSGEINTKQFVIEITANSNNGFKIYDLILKHGNEGAENMLLWVQNANESKSDSVQIGEGIKATSNITNTEATMNSEGFQVQNKTTKKAVMKATATGGLFNDLTSTGNSTISGLIIRKSGTKVTLNGEV